MARILVVLLVLVFTGLFALLNWTAFTTPTTLQFGFGSFVAPLGMIMLGLVAIVSVVFTVWALSLQASLLADQRRQARELQAQRELADQAEASRFTELRQFLAEELQRVREESAAAHAGLMTRFGQMEMDTRRHLEDTEHSLAATLGALDDRLTPADGSRLQPPN